MTPVHVHVAAPTDLADAIDALGLGGPHRVVAVVGGAGLMEPSRLDALAEIFTGVIAPAVRDHDAIAVDGGTDDGVMRLLGRARAAGPPFPLVGVAATGTVRLPGPAADESTGASLDPNHSHFVLVPGTAWGDEAPWLARVATLLAGPLPAVTVLVNGGEIAYDDVRQSIEAGRPVLVLAGTGRTADEIAAAASDPVPRRDSRAVALARSPLVRVTAVTDRAATAARLRELLTP